MYKYFFRSLLIKVSIIAAAASLKTKEIFLVHNDINFKNCVEKRFLRIILLKIPN